MVFESGPKTVQILELFTSEGCSSCPPAEAWLSRLTDDPRLWHEFVPLAFHVDYWDRLGWKDPFASPEWTKRQENYSKIWRSSSVYTPGFVLNGREWRNSSVPESSETASGNLKVTVKDNDRVTAVFESAKPEGEMFELHIARLGFGLTTNVRGGENSGRHLQHDFVVLSLAHEKLGPASVEIQLAAIPSSTGSGRRGIAAWITKPGDATPLQATGGWLSAAK
jgi:hypothetical protein